MEGKLSFLRPLIVASTLFCTFPVFGDSTNVGRGNRSRPNYKASDLKEYCLRQVRDNNCEKKKAQDLENEEDYLTCSEEQWESGKLILSCLGGTLDLFTQAFEGIGALVSAEDCSKELKRDMSLVIEPLVSPRVYKRMQEWPCERLIMEVNGRAQREEHKIKDKRLNQRKYLAQRKRFTNQGVSDLRFLERRIPSDLRSLTPQQQEFDRRRKYYAGAKDYAPKIYSIVREHFACMSPQYVAKKVCTLITGALVSGAGLAALMRIATKKSFKVSELGRQTVQNLSPLANSAIQRAQLSPEQLQTLKVSLGKLSKGELKDFEKNPDWYLKRIQNNVCAIR